MDPYLESIVNRVAEADVKTQENFARGIFPALEALLPQRFLSDDAGIHWVHRPDSGYLEGNLFADGSAFESCTPAARAGWSLVQVNDNGQLIAAALGAVSWDMAPQQLVLDAEDYAAAMSAQIGNQVTSIHSDCAGTVAVSLWPRQRQTGASNERAHLWSRLREAHPDLPIYRLPATPAGRMSKLAS